MKKKIIIPIILFLLIIIGLLIYFFVKNKEKENRDYQIEQITDYKYFVSKSQDSQKFGVIDTSGNVVIDEQYDDVQIPNPSKAVFICINGDSSKVFNSEAQEIYTEFGEISTLRLKNTSSDLIYEKSVLKYEQNGKFGLIGIDGKKLTEPIYDSIDTLQYKEGELIVKQNDKYGIINQKGYILVDIEYDEITADGFYDMETQYRYDGYIVANKTDMGYRYGYVFHDGKQILDLLYNDLKRITNISDEEPYLLVAENGRYGVMKKSTQIISNEYQSISYDASNNIFVVQKGQKYGVMDFSGKQIIECKYPQIDVKGRNIYVTKDDNMVEVYDTSGNLTNMSSDLIYIDIPEKDDYSIRIQTIDQNTTYQICKEGEDDVQEEYQYIEYLENDLFVASKSGGNLGIIDLNGDVKTEFKYSSIQIIPNTDLIQMVNTDNITVDFADKTAKIITQMANVTITNNEHFIKLSNSNESKYINLDGKEISNIEAYPNNLLFAVSKDGKWGYTDKEGNIKVEAIYDKVTEFNKYGFAGVLKDGKWGIIKQDGTILVQPSYEIDSQIEPYFIGEYYQVKYGLGQMYYMK